MVRPLIGLAQSALQVLGIRVADRVGKGIRTSPRDALIADSVDPAIRGRAFGFHNAADNLGAVLGPLIAFAFLRWEGLPLRTRLPAHRHPRRPGGADADLRRARGATDGAAEAGRGRPISRPRSAGGSGPTSASSCCSPWATRPTPSSCCGRRDQLGVATGLHPDPLGPAQPGQGALPTRRAASSRTGSAASRSSSPAGCVYAAVYFLFGRASQAWQAWALFAVYGLYFGLTEGVEKALVADLVPADRRGAAFGWYNLAIGIGALPASLLFGALWDRWGSATAFNFGALLALVAAVGVMAVDRAAPPPDAVESRLPERIDR